MFTRRRFLEGSLGAVAVLGGCTAEGQSAGTPLPIPELVETHTVSDDGLVHTMALRQGVMFHNGEELKAADAMDRHGNKLAKDLIAAIKINAPLMAQTVADRAMQVHGAIGFSRDFPLATIFTTARYLRMADGPDEVHMAQLAKLVMAQVAEGRR